MPQDNWFPHSDMVQMWNTVPRFWEHWGNMFQFNHCVPHSNQVQMWNADLFLLSKFWYTKIGIPCAVIKYSQDLVSRICLYHDSPTHEYIICTYLYIYIRIYIYIRVYIYIQTYVNLYACIQFLSRNIHVQVTPLACSTLYVHHPYNHGPAPSWGPVLTKTPPWVWGQCKYGLVGQDVNPCRIGVVCWTNFSKGA